MHEIKDETVRATKLRVQVALLAHTKYVKVWKARQAAIDIETAEEERMNEERKI